MVVAWLRRPLADPPVLEQEVVLQRPDLAPADQPVPLGQRIHPPRVGGAAGDVHRELVVVHLVAAGLARQEGEEEEQGEDGPLAPRSDSGKHCGG